VHPGDLVEIHAEIEDRVSHACYLRGEIRVSGELAVRAEFACMLTTEVV
jgi:hypothetical protein